MPDVRGLQAGRVKLHLVNGPARPEVVAIPKHKKHPPAGTKATTRTQVHILRPGAAACQALGTP